MRRYLAGEPIRARPIGRLERLWRWCKRKPGGGGAGGRGRLALLVGTAVSSYFAVTAMVERDRADEERHRGDCKCHGEAKANAIRADKRKQPKQKPEKAQAEDDCFVLAKLNYYQPRLALPQRQLSIGNYAEAERGPRNVARIFSRMGTRLFMDISVQPKTRYRWTLSMVVECGISARTASSLPRGATTRRLRFGMQKTAEEIRTLKAEGGVATVTFSPDGQRLISGGWDTKNLRSGMWPSGQQIAALHNQSGKIVSEKVTISPDGRWIAACGGR